MHYSATSCIARFLSTARRPPEHECSHAKEGTDTDLLTYAIGVSIGEREFFLRKTIGWALREYARTDPGWVQVFVAGHPDLCALSRREALKHL